MTEERGTKERVWSNASCPFCGKLHVLHGTCQISPYTWELEEIEGDLFRYKVTLYENGLEKATWIEDINEDG